MGSITVRSLTTLGEPEIEGLSDVLIDCVEGGASVSFMLPMTRAKAESFWRNVSASAVRGERVGWSPVCDHGVLQSALPLSGAGLGLAASLPQPARSTA